MTQVSLTQFSITLSDSTTVHGEYEGNSDSKKAIIFVHGFGVKRDSRGKFTEISDSIKHQYLVVRFDLVEDIPVENATKVYPYSRQVRMLESVISYTKNSLQCHDIIILGHSMGCIPACQVSDSCITKVILLSPSTENPYKKFKAFFSAKGGTFFDENGRSRLQRADGSWTYIDQDFWPEIQSVNPVAITRQTAQKYDLHFVRANHDEILGNQDDLPISECKYLTYHILDANHGFNGDSRQPLIALLKRILTS